MFRPLLLTLVGSIALLPLAAGAAPKMEPPKLAYEKHVLNNGLQLILHEDHSTPIVAVNLWYHVGSKNEEVGRTGFAHLFEHMMFQGSEHFNTDFFKAVEPIGATDLNGTTNFDRTNYFENVPPNALERTLWLEADRMGWLLPAMTQERLDNQREVVKNERRQGVDNQPYGTVEERMYAVLYPANHPYSWDVIGSMADLGAATKEDVEAFFKTYYGPNNCTLVVAGDIDVRETKKLVEKYFGAIPAGPPVKRMEEWIPELTRPVNLSMEDRVPLPRVYVAWHAPAAFQPGEADLDVLADVLAKGKNSRLYKRLVYDLQIAQEVDAYVDTREIGSLFWIEVTAKEGHTLDELEPLVFEEVERLRNKGPSAAEVDRVRTGILADFTRGLERIGGFGGKSDRLGMYNTYTGNPGHFEKDFVRFRDVTPASVRDAARRWLHEGRAVMRVNPYPEWAASTSTVDMAQIPDVGEPPRLSLPKLQRTRLSNGLEIVLAQRDKAPLVQLELLVGGGWSADQKDALGVASFMSRMQDEGTKSRTALQISEEAGRLGARLSSASSLDDCRVSLNALKAKLAPSLELWADVVRNPVFPPEEIERQRQHVLGQITQEKKRPFSMGIRILPVLLYGENHPYGQPLTGSGTESSVRAIARRDLVDFHSKWFRPNNATLVVVGDTSLEEIVPVLEKTLGTWQQGDVPKIVIPERPQPAKTKVYVIDKPEAAQSVLLIGHLAPPRNNPDDIGFKVLNTVFGGQFSSRINLNLREDKGYSYGAFSLAFPARGQGAFLALSQVRTDVTKESIAEIMKELREIRGKRPVTADELEFAQDKLTLSLPGQYETLEEIADKISDIVTYDLPEDYYSQYPEKVRATTIQSLTALAKKRILPDQMVVVVVGDQKVIEPRIRELGLGPIEMLDPDGRPLTMRAGRSN